MQINVSELNPKVASAIRTYNDFNPPKEIQSIQDLAALTEADVLRIPGCGRKTLDEVKEFLAKHGLKLKPGRWEVILENEKSHITLRDQFAMAALPALIKLDSIETVKEAAKAAYYIADAMLKARETQND
jgi:hypothetical protein